MSSNNITTFKDLEDRPKILKRRYSAHSSVSGNLVEPGSYATNRDFRQLKLRIQDRGKIVISGSSGAQLDPALAANHVRGNSDIPLVEVTVYYDRLTTTDGHTTQNHDSKSHLSDLFAYKVPAEFRKLYGENVVLVLKNAEHKLELASDSSTLQLGATEEVESSDVSLNVEAAPLPPTSDPSGPCRSSMVVDAPAAAGRSSDAPAAAGARSLVIDSSASMTNVKIRMVSGNTITKRFNHTHTIGDLYNFVASEPVHHRLAADSFTLTVPRTNRSLNDRSQTLAEARLLNCLVTQVELYRKEK